MSRAVLVLGAILVLSLLHTDVLLHEMTSSDQLSAIQQVPETEAVTSSVSTDSVEQAVLPNSEKTTSLTRLAQYGVEFIDDWRPINYEFTTKLKEAYDQGFGHPNVTQKSCTVENGSRTSVASRMHFHGTFAC